MEEINKVSNLYSRPDNIVGRPNGSRRPATLSSKYPIEWKAYYDPWLVEYVRGVPIKEIAKHYNFSEIQVGNVLRSPAAKERLKDIGAKILEAGVDSVVQESLRINAIKDKALKKMEDFLDDPNGLAQASAFAFIDRVVKINANVSAKPNPTNVNINNTNIDASQKTLVISQQSAENIAKALEMSKDL
jgi:hypothetical protein